MIEKTIYSEGKNQFKDNRFSSCEWSAPIMVSPSEIEDRIAGMQLVGRTITGVRILGYSYFHTQDWIEERAYNSLPDEMPRAEKLKYSDYDNISDDLEFNRCAYIDEPFCLQFADGDTFEIDTPQEPEYSFSMNCIPWSVQGDENNVDAAILFAPILNKKIVEVEIAKDMIEKNPMTMWTFDEEGTQREVVSRIVLWLEDGIGICVKGWSDYCEVACINRSNEVIPISFGELKKALTKALG